MLAARIDRLGEDQKHVLRAGAVVGAEFGHSVIERVASRSGALDAEQLAAALAELVQAEFLYEKALYPEREYAFRHPLTRAVAYDSQLQARREELHRDAALALHAFGRARFTAVAPGLLAWDARGCATPWHGGLW